MRHVKQLLRNSYLTGLAGVAAVVASLASMQGVFGGGPPVLLCLAAVLLAVWRGNLGAGLMTAAASVIASAYFLVEPYHSLMVSKPSEILRLALLAVVGGLLSVVMASVRKRETQALQSVMKHALQLRAEVAQRQEAEQALLAAKAQLEHGVAHCTAELHAADLEIRRQNRYMDAFFQHSLTPLVVLDRDFNFIRVNQAYAAACQRAVEEFAGRNHFELYPSDARAIFEDVVRTHRPFQAVARPFVFPDHPEWGTTYWDWTLTPLLEDGGEVEVLFFALEDVTVRKQNELELEDHRNHLESLVREQTGELEQANERLQADIAAREAAERKRVELEGMLTKLAETAPGVLCSFRLRPDGSMCFPYASPAISEIYGLPPAALAADAGPAFALIPPDDAERLRASLTASAEVLSPWHDEWRVRNPEKGEIWVEGKSIPAPEPDGCILWFGFIHDITDRKRVEEELHQADLRKNEFLAMLGHELRNPLAPIRNAVQILKLQTPRDSTEQWARDVIERQISHMARLLDDLLDVARIMYGKVRLVREPVDLAGIVDAAIETCRPLMEARHQALAVCRPDSPLWVEGDRVRLTQVLSNLLNNAAKYTGEGGKIEVRLSGDGQFADLRVRDNGIGITPECLARIFDLFIQADRALPASQGGLGIGLTLARRLVEMHGGNLSARSAGIGEGSEFSMRLPLLPVQPEVSAAPALARLTVPSTRILVVDDFADVADTLALLLRSGGHQVKVAYSGAEALEEAPAFRPEVVLMDIGLPDMDGHEVARRLRQMPETRDAALIALTGYGQPKDIESSRLSGFDRHLVKPVEFTAINALLAALADRLGRAVA